MEKSAALDLIRLSSLFKGLDAAAIEDVHAAMREQRVAKGETLFEQGMDATHCYIVALGRIKLSQTTADGQQVVLRFMGQGDLLGCVAVFRKIPYPATAVAVDDSILFSWSAPTTSGLMERHPAMAMSVINTIGGRIEELQQRLREIATERVERRIAHALLRLARQSGRRGKRGVEIPFALSRQDLAEMTATTLHTVSRTISAWEQAGLVESGRQRVVILDPHRLVTIAEDLEAPGKR